MPVVAGISAFRDGMAAHVDEYVLIGGGACSLLLEEAGFPFRLTNDLDIVILTDKCDASFAQDFWAFIKRGKYVAGRRAEGRCSYYRFTLPNDSPLLGMFPSEIELFARRPDFELMDESSYLAPLPFDEAISSLSAIILDDGYYEFIRDNITTIDGVPVVTALSIIPLKMRAHIDNNRLHDEGVSINQKNRRKHRSDVCTLTTLLPRESRLKLEGIIREDAMAFFDDLRAYGEQSTDRKLRGKVLDALELLQQVYL